MQLKTSYLNKTIFKKNMTRFWPVYVIYTLIMIFIMPVSIWSRMPYSSMSNLSNINVETILTSEVFHTGIVVGSNIVAVFAVLAAMSVFSYLYVSKSACMFHALPVRREGFFVTNYISGLCFLVIPNIVVFILSVIVKSAVGFPDLSVLWTWLGVISAMSLFYYSFGVFCAMLTGHILALPVFYGILNVIVVGLELFTKLIMSAFVFGMRMNDQMVLAVLSPLYNMNAMRITQDDKIGQWSTFVAYAVAGVVFAVLALLIYRKRPIETAGDIVAVKPVKPVFKYGTAFSAALLLGYILFEIFGQGNAGGNAVWLLLVFMLLSGFVGYYAAEMLLQKSFRVIRRGLKGWLVFSIVLVILMMAGKLDVLGFERYVPDASSIREAYVSQYITMASSGDADSDNNPNTKDKEVIRQIIRLHENIIQSKAAIEDYEYRSGVTDSYYTPNSTSVMFCYVLADGRRVFRSYIIPVTEELLSDEQAPAAQFEALINDPEHILRSLFPKDLSKEDFQNGTVYFENAVQESDGMSVDQAYNSVSVTINQEQSYQLYLAVIEDIKAGGIGKTYLYNNDEYYDTMYTCTISLGFNRRLIQNFRGSYYVSGGGSMQLGKASVNTIAALDQFGLLDNNQLFTQGEVLRKTVG